MSDGVQEKTNSVCPTCGDEFRSYHGVKIHHQRQHGESIANKVELSCDWCGSSYERHPCNVGESKYCSNTCQQKARAEQNGWNESNSNLTAGELEKEHQRLHTNGDYKEKHFQEAIEFVLEKNGVEFESEKKITEHTGKPTKGKRIDLYIPKTDTAIELKLEPNERGVGQAAYYATRHNESILLSQRGFHDQRIKDTVDRIPDVHYALAMPNLTATTPFMAVQKDTDTAFFDGCEWGSIGDNDAFLKHINTE